MLSSTLLRTFVFSALAIAVAGCSSTPKMPSTFLNPANRMTAEDGRRLMDEGERVIKDAEADIARGKLLIKDARKRHERGEALMSRGRQALEAAAMAEEAERLSRKARDLKTEALPSSY